MLRRGFAKTIVSIDVDPARSIGLRYVSRPTYVCCRRLVRLTSVGAVTSPLLHHQHTPKPRMPTHQMLKRIISFLKRELLNHASDAMKLCKGNGFLGIEFHARRPAADRGALVDQGQGVDFDLTNCYPWSAFRLVSIGTCNLRAKRTNFPDGANPFTRSPMMSGIGAVLTIIAAPPIFIKASA